jgi:hypothetical protein
MGRHRSAFAVHAQPTPQASRLVPSSSRLRRLPWLLILLTVLLAISSIIPADAIRNAVDFTAVADARLERSMAYWLLGPISSVFDALTLFSVPQIIGFTLWVFVVYGVSRAVRRRDKPSSAVHEFVYAVVGLVGLLIVYAAAIAMPRPMARLVTTRGGIISVDFHSHTKYSHDGRPGWSATKVRDWHTAAGYDVAYITDHATFDGVAEGIALDSGFVGQGNATTLLPGLEAFFHGEHVNVLNAGVRYLGLTTADYRQVDDQALSLASLINGAEPVLIETIPGNLNNVIPAAGPRTAGVRAIEIVDGSPRGMSQTYRDHDRILGLADSLNLALVAGSDNHGWGRAAPGWTLLKIPGVWRTYKPDSLANMIDEVIRVAGRRGTYVVERTTASRSPIGVAFALPVVAWTVMRTLSSPERIAWLVWLWVPYAIVVLARRRRSTLTT